MCQRPQPSPIPSSFRSPLVCRSPVYSRSRASSRGIHPNELDQYTEYFVARESNAVQAATEKRRPITRWGERARVLPRLIDRCRQRLVTRIPGEGQLLLFELGAPGNINL